MTKAEILEELPLIVKTTCPECGKKTVFYGIKGEHPRCLLCGFAVDEIILPSEGFWVEKKEEDVGESSNN